MKKNKIWGAQRLKLGEFVFSHSKPFEK